MTDDRFTKAVKKIFDLQFFGIKLGLVNIRKLLDDLGNPQNDFKAVLVAGTNGKGSTASTLASIGKESGMTCGLFTSPHLVRFNERFAVNGRQITDDEVMEIADRLWSLVERRREEEDPNGPAPITFFEFATAMACLFFKNHGCDLVVFECGLGGRLDATNALDPILTVFTPISMDHMQYLGNTLTSIANEKAGILRRCVPAVVSHQEKETLIALSARFQEMEVPSLLFDRDFGIRREPGKAVYWDAQGELQPVKTALPGAYQLENTTVAMAAARVLQQQGLPIDNESILRGPLNVFWPGRLETVAKNPTIILDGAHNEAAARLLVTTLKEEEYAGKTVAVLAMMSDKDVKNILPCFAPAFDAVVATRVNMPRAAAPEALAELLRSHCPAVHVSSNLKEGLEKARSLAGENGRVVICGSLYLVGEARALLVGEKGQGANGEWVGIRG